MRRHGSTTIGEKTLIESASFDTDGKTRLAMKETQWYQKDLFGLRTADEAGKIMFDSTPGNHLQFTDAELLGFVDKYFLE